MEITPKHDELTKFVESDGRLSLPPHETQLFLKWVYLTEKTIFDYESLLHEYARLQTALRKITGFSQWE